MGFEGGPVGFVPVMLWLFFISGFSIGRVRVMVTELWSVVVSWLMARARMSLLMFPLERQRSIIDGLVPFLGWCDGSAIFLWRWKSWVSSQSAMVWEARDILIVGGWGPCHQIWWAFRSPNSMVSVGGVNVESIAARWSGFPGE